MILSQGRMKLTEVGSSWLRAGGRLGCAGWDLRMPERSRGAGAGVDVGTVIASLAGS